MKKILLLIVFVIVIFLARELANSQVAQGGYKFSLVKMDQEGQVDYISYDPRERKIFTLVLPSEMEISSRSSGLYSIGKLYAIGKYEEKPGEFVRKKVQGFMKVPIQAYLVTKLDLPKALIKHIWTGKEGSLTRADALILLVRYYAYLRQSEGMSELIKAAVYDPQQGQTVYESERLQQYLSGRVFDWKIGSAGVTTAVVNTTEENGLGADVARLISNTGIDLVGVRSNGEKKEKTEVVVQEGDREAREVAEKLASWLGWEKVREGDTNESRSRLVIYLGLDSMELF